MRRAIGLLTVATGRAGATGVSGVDHTQGHACPGGFVGEELAELEERPRMPRVTMFVTNRDPLPDATQVFERECLARYDGFGVPRFSQCGDSHPVEAAFFARVLAQAALGVLGVDRLKTLAALVIAGANHVHLSAAEGLPLTIGRQIDNTQVNTQRAAIWRGKFWRFATLRSHAGSRRPCAKPDQRRRLPRQGLPTSRAGERPRAGDKRRAPPAY